MCCGCEEKTMAEQMNMTEEEFQEYRQSCIHKYPLCSVTQYIKTVTNRFGGVIDTDLCYAFTYLDGGNNLRTVDDFQHFDYGLTKVITGEENMYMEDTYGETVRYLVLTPETLKSISNLQGEK